MVTPDLRYIVAGGQDKSMSVLSLDFPKRVHTFPEAHQSEIFLENCY